MSRFCTVQRRLQSSSVSHIFGDSRRFCVSGLSCLDGTHFVLVTPPIFGVSSSHCRRASGCRFFASATTSQDTNQGRQILLDHLSNPDSDIGGIVSILTLNRPNAANAIGKTMLQELQQALTELEYDAPSHSHNQDQQKSQSPMSQSRCVIIASSSSRVFSAGADLKERRSMSSQATEGFVTDLRHSFQRISELPMPVIAAISGAALGGGLELALCCDIRIAQESAVLGLVETSLAIVPGAGGTQRLPRLIGLSKAKEMIFTATPISAAQALEYGLVDYVVNDETSKGASPSSNPQDGTSSSGTQAPSPKQPQLPVLDKALELAWRIASNGPLAIQAAKRAMNHGMFAPKMQAALDVERQCYSTILNTHDRLEGLAAFAQKRKPQFRGE